MQGYAKPCNIIKTIQDHKIRSLKAMLGPTRPQMDGKEKKSDDFVTSTRDILFNLEHFLLIFPRQQQREAFFKTFEQS